MSNTEEITVIRKEKPDSIKVAQNAKGDYSFEVKIYCLLDDYHDYHTVIDKIEAIYTTLHTKF